MYSAAPALSSCGRVSVLSTPSGHAATTPVVAVAAVVLAEAAPPALVSPIAPPVTDPVEALPPSPVVLLPASVDVAVSVLAMLLPTLPVSAVLGLAEPVLAADTVCVVPAPLGPAELVVRLFVPCVPATLPIPVVEPELVGAPESELLQPRAKASGSARVIARIERGLLEAISLNARADRIDQPSCRVFSNGAIYPVQLDSNWGTSPSSRG